MEIATNVEVLLQWFENFFQVIMPIVVLGISLNIAMGIVLIVNKIYRKMQHEALEYIAEHPDEIEHLGFMMRRMVYHNMKRKRKPTDTSQDIHQAQERLTWQQEQNHGDTSTLSSLLKDPKSDTQVI